MSFLSHLGRNAPLHLLLAIAVCGAFVSCTTPEPAWRHWTAPSAIRTLDILSERHIRYAAAKGWVGETTDAGIQWNEQRWMAPDSTFPSFRASGWNGKAWFVASIASPGWIGRCTDLNTVPEWVHQDTNETVFFDAMAWWNPEEGLVFGDPVSGCLTLLVTRDGGNTWRAADCENVPPHEPGEAGFAASNGNIALSGDTAWVFTGGKGFTVFAQHRPRKVLGGLSIAHRARRSHDRCLFRHILERSTRLGHGRKLGRPQQQPRQPRRNP